jgi:hypothetical protein
MKPSLVKRVAEDINRRLEPDASTVVTAETEALYRSMPYQALVTLKVAFTLDRDQSTNETTRAFCQSRIDLIERVRKV